MGEAGGIEPYWVFGYGSLIWKPPPHAIEKRGRTVIIDFIDGQLNPRIGAGYIKGVVRRFAQSSNDHRGTPEATGRVVTVIQAGEWHRLVGSQPDVAGEDFVWGVAYRIDPQYVAEVKAYLEYREKNGYTEHSMQVYQVVDGREVMVVSNALVWIGRLDNPAFVGFEEPDSLASIIYERVGPSGSNKDYLYKLSAQVRQLWPQVKDDYLFDLEARVRALDA